MYMLPIVIEYLRDHTFRQLELEHGIDSRPASDGSKFSLNYDQLTSKKGAPISDQCRGLIVRPMAGFILDGTDSWKDRIVGECVVVARPMDRFYNHGDAYATNVDVCDVNSVIFEKLDGTMCIVYWDDVKGLWCVGTRAVCEADLPIRKDDMQIGDMTFADLFWEAAVETLFGHIEGDVVDKAINLVAWRRCLEKSKTYVFELTSQHNRVVVKYDSPRITLLAVRNTQTGEENNIEYAGVLNVPLPMRWSFSTVAALEAFVDASDPAKLEGAVACNMGYVPYARMKVKSKAWCLSSRAKDLVTVSRRSALAAIILDQMDDVIPLVDADTAAKLEAMIDATRDFFVNIDAVYADCRHQAGNDKKSFAILATDSGAWTTPLFRMFHENETSSRKWAQRALDSGRLTSSGLETILSRLDVKPQ